MSLDLIALVVEAPEAPSAHTIGTVVKEAASYVLALGVLFALGWRILRPHFDRLVREAVATRKTAESTASDLSGLPDQVRAIQFDLARLTDLPQRVARVEGRVDALSAAVMGVPNRREGDWLHDRVSEPSQGL